MSGVRSWLGDNQQSMIRIAGSLAFVTAAGGIVAWGVRAYLLALVLTTACGVVTIAFTVMRAVLVRAPWLGGLGVLAGIVATLLQLQGFWTRSLAIVAWTIVAWVASVLLRRPVEGHPPIVPSAAEAAPRPPDPPAVEPQPTAIPRPRAGEPGFEYPSPPKP